MDKRKILFYILKRAIFSIFTVFFITTIVFLISRIIPGGPFVSLKNASPQIKKILERSFGLDKPIIVQYFSYIRNIFKFNFGTSISKRGVSVLEIISGSYKYSLLLGLVAASISIFFGIIIGCLAAINNNKIFDKIVTSLTLSFVSIPLFVIACLINKMLSGFFSCDGLSRFILPSITLSISPLCTIIRLTKSSVLETLNSNFIKYLRAKGIDEWSILFKHALINSLYPIIAYIGPMIGEIITGNIIIEHSFGIPGVGEAFISYISLRDYPVVMGMTIFFTSIIVMSIFITDVLNAIINPNIDFN